MNLEYIINSCILIAHENSILDVLGYTKYILEIDFMSLCLLNVAARKNSITDVACIGQFYRMTNCQAYKCQLCSFSQPSWT